MMGYQLSAVIGVKDGRIMVTGRLVAPTPRRVVLQRVPSEASSEASGGGHPDVRYRVFFVQSPSEFIFAWAYIKVENPPYDGGFST